MYLPYPQCQKAQLHRDPLNLREHGFVGRAPRCELLVFEERAWVVCLHGEVLFCSPPGPGLRVVLLALCHFIFPHAAFGNPEELALAFNDTHAHMQSCVTTPVVAQVAQTSLKQ